MRALWLILALALSLLMLVQPAHAASVAPEATCTHHLCVPWLPDEQDARRRPTAYAEHPAFPSRLLLPVAVRAWTALVPARSPDPPAPPAVRRIVDVALDPGHSRVDVGARGDELAEYRLTLEVALRLRARLEAAGLSVALTRTDDQPASSYDHPDLTERIRIEQEARQARVAPARVYLSLHFNGFGDSRVRGTETYYNEDNFGPESILLARTVQRHVVAALRRAGYPAIDRGAKSDLWAGKPYGHFFSLRGPFPSALLEAAFLTNPIERQWLREAAALDAIADGCAAALIEVLTVLP